MPFNFSATHSLHIENIPAPPQVVIGQNEKIRRQYESETIKTHSRNYSSRNLSPVDLLLHESGGFRTLSPGTVLSKVGGQTPPLHLLGVFPNPHTPLASPWTSSHLLCQLSAYILFPSSNRLIPSCPKFITCPVSYICLFISQSPV